MGVGGKCAANQLAGAEAAFVPGQLIHGEDSFQVAIAVHQAAPRGLKIALRQLCFDEQIA